MLARVPILHAYVCADPFSIQIKFTLSLRQNVKYGGPFANQTLAIFVLSACVNRDSVLLLHFFCYVYYNFNGSIIRLFKTMTAILLENQRVSYGKYLTVRTDVFSLDR